MGSWHSKEPPQERDASPSRARWGCGRARPRRAVRIRATTAIHSRPGPGHRRDSPLRDSRPPAGWFLSSRRSRISVGPTRPPTDTPALRPPRGLLPLRLGGQTFTGPGRVGGRFLPRSFTMGWSSCHPHSGAGGIARPVARANFRYSATVTGRLIYQETIQPNPMPRPLVAISRSLRAAHPKLAGRHVHHLGPLGRHRMFVAATAARHSISIATPTVDSRRRTSCPRCRHIFGMLLQRHPTSRRQTRRMPEGGDKKGGSPESAPVHPGRCPGLSYFAPPGLVVSTVRG